MFNLKPTVDILMATYNGEEFIADQIQSIFDQTYDNFRLLIADDNSTDNTRDILLKYAHLDKRIELVFNNLNLGVIKNFEKLLSLSDADYFMLSDQDDFWHVDKIEKSIGTIMFSDALLVYSDLTVVDRKLNKIHESFWRYEGIMPIKENDWKLMLSQNVVTGCTIIAKKKLVKLALPFPNNLPMHDWYLAIIAAVNGKIDFVDESLIKYRQHENNQIGANGIFKTITSLKNYNVFLEYRKKMIESRIAVSQISCSEESLNNKELAYHSNYLFKMYKRCLNVKFIDVTMLGFRLKFKYQSQGKLRNVWWASILSFPYFTYLFLKLIVRMKLLENGSGGLK